MRAQEIQDNLDREELRLASIKKRAIAAFIDELLLSLLLLFTFSSIFGTATTLEDSITLTNKFILEFIAIKFIYQAFFIMQYGATVGKIIMKIEVIEAHSFQKPNVLVALNRSAIRIVSESAFYLGYVWAFNDPLKQTWHDKSAKTVVIDA